MSQLARGTPSFSRTTCICRTPRTRLRSGRSGSTRCPLVFGTPSSFRSISRNCRRTVRARSARAPRAFRSGWQRNAKPTGARPHTTAAERPRWAGPTPSGRDLAYLALNLISAGDAAGGREALRQALKRSNTEYVREDLIANAFMRLGDRESAIQWLVKGAASNVGGINFSLEDSLYAPIRSDPRIQAIIERLKVR